MLSHHELAALMLLNDAKAHLKAFDPDVLALRRYQLVEVRKHERDGPVLTLTERGRELLRRLRTSPIQLQ